jgi:PAS domain S-box-containing protein
MDETLSASVYLGDARLAAHAPAPTAVWLWSADGARMLWANPAGCAALGARTAHALLERRFAIGHPARTQIERLGDLLPPGGGSRLFRLRGIGGGGWSSLTCSCSRFDLGRTPGILVAATEPVGAEMPLGERVQWLGFAETAAVAAFGQDGARLFATAAAEPRLAGVHALDAIGAGALAAEALAAGRARGETRIGTVILQRIGRGADTVLLATFPPPAAPCVADANVQGAAVPPPQPLATSEPAPKQPARTRRHPLRFVWQIDSTGRFSLGSDEFARVIGARADMVSGRSWQDLDAELRLDPAGRVAQAVASRETWSNIAISWPVEGSDERLEVELAGLPAFDRNRNFLGYRGFGVCRDIDRIERLSQRRPSDAGPVATPATLLTTQSALPPPAAEHDVPGTAPPSEPAEPAPIAPNVVRFPGVVAFAESRGEADFPALSAGEHNAFHELARQLAVRLQGGDATPELRPSIPENLAVTGATGRLSPAAQMPARTASWMLDDGHSAFAEDDHPLLNRLPVGVLVYRYEEILFANRAFLAWTGYPDLEAVKTTGGLGALFLDAGVGALAGAGDACKRLAIMTRDGDAVSFEGRLFAIHWDGESAFAVLLFKSTAHEQIRAAEAALGLAEARADELERLLDRATDAILVVDRAGAILSCHGRGAALFGRGGSMPAGAAFETLFAPDARSAAASEFARAVREGGTVSNELVALAANGELRPMLVTIAPMPSRSDRSGPERWSIVLHDTVETRRVEPEILSGPARVSRVQVSLNEVVSACVAAEQAAASEARVVIRTALSPGLPAVLADADAVRSMVVNLLGHAMRTTRPGGQVIVSTGRSSVGETVLRVRDSGNGLNEEGAEGAPEAASRSGISAGEPSGFAHTKALAEANQARLTINRKPYQGSLFEVAFLTMPEGASPDRRAGRDDAFVKPVDGIR